MTALDKQAREERDKAGRFMLQKGVHMGDTIDAGLVQDWLVQYATQTLPQTSPFKEVAQATAWQPPRVHCTLIVRNQLGRFLLLHFKQKDKLRWRFAGGKPEVGETLIAAAARECKEEIGVEPLILFLHAVRQQNIDGAIWKGYYFICDRYIGTPAIQEPEKHDELRWLTPEQIATFDTGEPEREISKLLNVYSE